MKTFTPSPRVYLSDSKDFSPVLSLRSDHNNMSLLLAVAIVLSVHVSLPLPLSHMRTRVGRFSALSFSNDNYPSIGRPLVLETKMDGICVECSGCCVVAATRNYTVGTIEPPPSPPPPPPPAFNETLNLSFLIASEGHSLLQRISIVVRTQQLPTGDGAKFPLLLGNGTNSSFEQHLAMRTYTFVWFN